jgi:hypothetical protein
LVRQSCYHHHYLKTNVMADYLDKMSTDVNYITYIEENEEECHIQVFIIIVLLIYMFIDD